MPAGRKPVQAFVGPLLLCTLFVLFFVCIAWCGVRKKCATFDEPNDSIESWIATRYADYRISPADPPLAYYWAALPQPKDALQADFNSTNWKEAAIDPMNEHHFSADTLYRTPGNDADGFLRRSRAMMLALGALTAALMGWWGWRMGGAACAVAAVGLICLDPNFLAHAPLVKNDVSMALAAVLLMSALWAVGRRADLLRILLLGLACGLVLCVKFNGPLFGPIVALALLGRAAIGDPWNILGRSFVLGRQKALAAVCICLACACISYVFIWGCYRFRFNPSSDAGFHLESRLVSLRCTELQLRLKRTGYPPTPSEVEAARPDVVPELALLLEEHRLLPEAYTNGVIRNYEGTRARSTFLLGQFSVLGWWYYFPLAFLFKTPLATLAAIAAAPLMLFRRFRPPEPSTGSRWTGICLGVPIIVYGAAALAGNLNLGIRHLLAIYPFIYLSVGLAFARLWRGQKPTAIIAGLALLILLSLETLAAFPNYIPFFNAAAGGSRGGLAQLSDSNLDWGQDLKLLVDWQHQHPSVPLYLCYFGTADPRYYGLRYTNLPGSRALGEDGAPAPEKLPPMSERGVIAISATNLQGTYLKPHIRALYQSLRGEPLTVLGGSIYLYPLGPDVPQN